MSKYDELQQEYLNVNREYYADRERSLNVAKQLVKGLDEYLGAPREHIRICPAHERPEEGKKYYLEHTLALEENSYWEFGVEIDFRDPGTLHSLWLRIPFAIRYADTQFKVKVGNKWFTVNNTDDHVGFQAIYDFIYETLLKYVRGANYPMNQSAPFGFITE